MKGKMKVKKETSVTRKLIIYFLLSNMVIAIIGTTIGLYNEISNYKKSVLTRFKKIERVNVPLLAEAIFHKNEKKIKQIIQNIKTWEDLTTLELTRLSHRSLEKKSPPHFSQHKDQKFLSHKLDIIYHKKGSQEKILVGNLLLKVSMSKMVQFLKNKVQTFILIQLVQFGLITIVLFALFYQLISKHLEKVFLYAQNLDINFRSNHDLTLDRKPSVHEDELDKVVDSINKMKKNVFDSHGDLQKYTTNLEEKVFQKTTAHSDAKKNMEYLLHNMRQAIFTVDENGTIEGPVSSFSKKIFESDIEGKNIFETIFSCLHEKSETYCSIKFANSCNFGSDKVQWNLILDQYPTKIILTKKKFDLEKILKINYTPLWNEKGLLFKIMYIVEDTTEIEKLESEMKDQKDEANKNVKVLQELGLNKKEDLQVFFSNIIKLSLESQALTKEIRSQIEKG
jgi:hypothetical protein